MWHTSVGRLATHAERERLARVVLQNTGDPGAGEWVEDSGRFTHLRRRLTEQEAADIGPPIDIRGTPDAAARMRVMRLYVPHGWGAQEF